MKKNLTWIVCVLDESGSMGSIKNDVIGSFNQFISEQQKVEGEASCTLVKFNSKIEKVYENMSILNIPNLDESNYKPSAMTRLYDAIGSTIKETKSSIKVLSEENKPEKVLFVILTDGQENTSKEFNRVTVFTKIAKREKKGWNFIYLGANQDAMKEGGKIGLSKGKTATWSADSEGIYNAFSAASSYATKYRSATTLEDIQSLDLNQELNDANNNKK
jgi:hypothetical protein